MLKPFKLICKFVSKLHLLLFGLILSLCMVTAHAGIVAGDPRGDVTLVEFYDITCPYCREMTPVIEQLIKAYPHLRVIYRPMPLLGPNALFANQMLVASFAQNKFHQLQDAFANSSSEITQNNSITIAGQSGLNIPSLVTQMKNECVTLELQDNLNLLHKMKINRIPTILIGSTLLKKPNAVFVGVTSYQELEQSILDSMSKTRA